jgi:cyclopropane fatty-acyl-phospholipid synthase-like methyltransferase
VAQLELPPRGRVLEIGCGGGHALWLAATLAPTCRLTGIDRSALQVRNARRRIAELEVKVRPRVELLGIDAAASRWAAEPFDMVFAINVNAFWTDPARAVPALTALLKPRGRAMLAYELPTAAGLARLRASLDTAFAGSAVRPVGEIVEERSPHPRLAMSFSRTAVR